MRSGKSDAITVVIFTIYLFVWAGVLAGLVIAAEKGFMVIQWSLIILFVMLSFGMLKLGEYLDARPFE
jgi:hypothetical protein